MGKALHSKQLTDLNAVGESLVAYGAPLSGWRPKKHMTFEKTLAGGLLLAKENATVLSVLPVVLASAASHLDPPALHRAAAERDLLPEMGMLLALTGEVAGNQTLAGLAERYPKHQEPQFFLDSDSRTAWRQTMARERTPRVVLRRGFFMNAPLEDFASRMRRFGSSPVRADGSG